MQPYQCQRCGKWFRQPSSSNRHHFECQKCGQCFTRACDFNQHVKNHVLRPFACRLCGSNYKREEDMKHDLRFSHECQECGQYFDLPGQLFQHERDVHFGEGPYECKLAAVGICGKRYAYGSSLRDHQRTVHAGEQIPFRCLYCSRNFSKWADKESHQIRHIYEQPYECSLCYKRFRHLRSVPLHERHHTGNKPHKCPHCFQRFHHLGALRLHKRYHTCWFCDQTFRDQELLRAHYQTHMTDFFSVSDKSDKTGF